MDNDFLEAFKKIKKQNSYRLGQVMERQAEIFWLSKYPGVLLHRNYRCQYGEIDLIFKENFSLIFVEVRARLQGGLVSAVESVDYKKQNRLKRAVNWFIMKYPKPIQDVRIDLLAWDGKTWECLSNLEFD